MAYERWEIYYAQVPFQEDPSKSSRHPILIWNETQAFVASYKMTSTNRGSQGMEYRLKEWKEAGLDHETSVRLEYAVRIDPAGIQEYVGKIQPADKLGIEKKMLNGR